MMMESVGNLGRQISAQQSTFAAGSAVQPQSRMDSALDSQAKAAAYLNDILGRLAAQLEPVRSIRPPQDKKQPAGLNEICGRNIAARVDSNTRAIESASELINGPLESLEI